MVTINDIISHLEVLVPLAYQESYDNSGLIVGDKSQEVKSVLLTLDCTEIIVQEAMEKGVNLIIAHHPIVFKDIRSLTGKNYVERTLIKAIKNDIAIYASHTNLDNVDFGVSKKIAEKLHLKNTQVLLPKSENLLKLSVLVPKSAANVLRSALHDSGAGSVGNYSECSYSSSGQGRFKPSEEATPYLGTAGRLECVVEEKVEVLLPAHLKSKVLQAMFIVHPYEEVAYSLIQLLNTNTSVGSGMVGELDSPMAAKEFLRYLRSNMQLDVIRHTKLVKDKIKKIAVCGGSGSFLLGQAKSVKADVYITSDFKYHEFFDAEDEIIVADIGHYESEVYTKELFSELLTYKFPNIVFYLSDKSTNPIVYFK